MKVNERPRFLYDQHGNIYEISWIKTRQKEWKTKERYWRFESRVRFLLSQKKPKAGGGGQQTSMHVVVDRKAKGRME